MNDLTVDRILAVVAMFATIRPVIRGTMGSQGQLSWKRLLALVVGAAAALAGAAGLLVLRKLVLGEPDLYVPSWLGSTLAAFGGMLGVATLLTPRGRQGQSEDQAIRYASQGLAMVAYVAAPRVVLLGLGGLRLLRGALPWTVAQGRWLHLVEGLALVLAGLLVRAATAGGVRTPLVLG